MYRLGRGTLWYIHRVVRGAPALKDQKPIG